MRFIKLFFASLALATSLSHAAAVACKDYLVVNNPQAVPTGKTIEVTEFFWYGCGHCYELEDRVEAWAARLPKDVVLKRMHVMWDGGGRNKHAQLFFALQAMNLLPRLHHKAFDAVQGRKVPAVELRDEGELANWIAQQGVDPKAFMAAYNSFGVNTMMNQAKQLGALYSIDSVPTFIVQGRYKTSPAQAAGEDRVFAVLNELIASERARLNPPAKAPAAKPAAAKPAAAKPAAKGAAAK